MNGQPQISVIFYNVEVIQVRLPEEAPYCVQAPLAELAWFSVPDPKRTYTIEQPYTYHKVVEG